MKKELWVNNI